MRWQDPFLDHESKLTAEAISRIKKHIASSNIQACCSDPKLATLDRSFQLLVLNKGHESGVTFGQKGGAPIVAVACTSCGQVMTFLAELIFDSNTAK